MARNVFRNGVVGLGLISLLAAAVCTTANTAEKKTEPATRLSAASAPATYSVSLRVRRITYEDAYISVPITDAVIKKKPDGKPGIDTEKLFAEGIRLSKEPKVEWQTESTSIDIHPIQKARPEDRIPHNNN